MSKILIIAENNNAQDSIELLLKGAGYDTFVANNENEAFELTNALTPDIAIVDTSCSGINVSTICRKLKLQSQTNDIQIILLTSKDSAQEDLLVGADGYITKPCNVNILIATVNAHLRIKKLLDILYTNNSELAKSLYQLNVLYNTSSQLAGTLNKSKLINIMNTGFEKSLNFSLCSAFIINDPENATLMISSLNPPAEELVQALKLRAMLGYKNLFEDKKLPFHISINNIKVETHFKEEGRFLDLSALSYDGLFAPINTADRFFGTVEILRENEFTGEDATCFQTVVKQVSLPLESAILYEEIKETNVKLEKLEKMKSEFISIVSHELRTPLTAVKNSLDIILSEKAGIVTPKQNNFLNMAKRNLNRLSGIINDLLDLSKIEAGKMEYRFEPFNICEALDFVQNTYLSLADKKNIKLEVDYDVNLPQVYGDLSKIEQILTNLVSNAVKFTTENGNIKISAILFKSKDIDDVSILDKFEIEGDYIKISIQDTGIGIEKDDMPKVFDKFQQIESTLSRDVGGTGLGLPIAKQLVEAHRGYIWLDSEPHKGTTFSFILPVMQNKTRFSLELDNFIQSSKYIHEGFALIICDSLHLSSDIIEIEHTRFFNDTDFSYMAIPSYKREEAESLIKRLKIKLNDNKGNFGLSVYPEDAITSDELIEIAENKIMNKGK